MDRDRRASPSAGIGAALATLLLAVSCVQAPSPGIAKSRVPETFVAAISNDLTTAPPEAVREPPAPVVAPAPQRPPAELGEIEAGRSIYVGQALLLADDGSHPSLSVLVGIPSFGGPVPAVVGRIPSADIPEYVNAYNAAINAELVTQDREALRDEARTAIVEITAGAAIEGRREAREERAGGALRLIGGGGYLSAEGVAYQDAYQAILEEAGVAFSSGGGCRTSRGLEIRTEAFNEVMRRAIARRHGRHFLARAQRRARASVEAADTQRAVF